MVYPKIVLGLCLLTSLGTALADDKQYSICTAGGYFTGADNKFLAGLAVHMMSKNDLILNDTCTSYWESAFDVGERITKTGKVKNEYDKIVIDKASKFSEQVYSKLAKDIKF